MAAARPLPADRPADCAGCQQQAALARVAAADAGRVSQPPVALNGPVCVTMHA